jgi:hypothetical protein
VRPSARSAPSRRFSANTVSPAPPLDHRHRLRERNTPTQVDECPRHGGDRDPVADDDLARIEEGGVETEVPAGAGTSAPGPRHVHPVQRDAPDRQTVEDRGGHVADDGAARPAREHPHRRRDTQAVRGRRVLESPVPGLDVGPAPDRRQPTVPAEPLHLFLRQTRGHQSDRTTPRRRPRRHDDGLPSPGRPSIHRLGVRAQAAALEHRRQRPGTGWNLCRDAGKCARGEPVRPW